MIHWKLLRNHGAYIDYQKFRTFLIPDIVLFAEPENVRNVSVPYFLTLHNWV